MEENTRLINVVAKKEVPGSFTAFLLEHDIIEIEWDIDLIEVQKLHVDQVKQIIRELGEGKRMRVYVSTNPLMHITSEARKYAVTYYEPVLTIANAILVDTLAKRLLFNFFLNVYRPKIPTRGFKSRENAFEWLQSIT